MFTVICKICGEEFSSDMKGRELKKLGTHLKKMHDMTPKQYVLKFSHNNINPKCKCGCGKDTDFCKWIFYTYYKDHKNTMKVPDDVRQKHILIAKYNSENTDYLKKFNITKDTLIDWYEKYKTKDYNRLDIEKIAGIDHRTIFKMWLYYEITTREHLKRLTQLHKNVYSNMGKKNGQYIDISDDILNDAYILLVNNKNKLSLKILLSIFNLKISTQTLEKKLIEKFTKKEIKSLFRGNSSQMENDFGFILTYYFKKKNITRQFRLENKIYDFKICDKILLEFDGEYWHKNKKDSDKEKDMIAVKNGYIIYRVSEKSRCDFNHIIKLLELVK